MGKSNADLLAMKAELASDPEALGYTDNDATDAEIVNAVRDTISIERFDIPVHEISQAINYAEFITLTAVDRQYLDLVLRNEIIDACVDTEPRIGFMAIFGAGTTTRTNLNALLSRDGSRAEELWQADVLESGANWTPSDIANARRAI